MTKNRLLNVVILLCRFCRILCVLLFLAMTTLLIHVQADRDSYNATDFQIKIDESPGVGITTKNKWRLDGEVTPEDDKVFTLDKLTTGSLIILFIKYSMILVLVFLSVKEFQMVVESVKKIQTFKIGNVRSFIRLGKYFFILFLLFSVSVYGFEQGRISIISIAFLPLVLMLLAFVMAEIFKEGNLLSEENELTV